MKMKSLNLSCLLCGFCLLNYFIDVWLCSLNPYYAAHVTLLVFASPMFVVRGMIFGITQACPYDCFVDIPLIVIFWTFVIRIILHFYNKHEKNS